MGSTGGAGVDTLFVLFIRTVGWLVGCGNVVDSLQKVNIKLEQL